MGRFNANANVGLHGSLGTASGRSEVADQYISHETLLKEIGSVSGRATQTANAIHTQEERCRRNLAIVSEHQGRLNGSEAFDRYEEAKVKLEAERQRYQAMRQQIHQLFLAVDAGLGQVIGGEGSQDTTSPGTAGGGMFPSAAAGGSPAFGASSFPGGAELGGLASLDL